MRVERYLALLGNALAVGRLVEQPFHHAVLGGGCLEQFGGVLGLHANIEHLASATAHHHQHFLGAESMAPGQLQFQLVGQTLPLQLGGKRVVDLARPSHETTRPAGHNDGRVHRVLSIAQLGRCCRKLLGRGKRGARPGRRASGGLAAPFTAALPVARLRLGLGCLHFVDVPNQPSGRVGRKVGMIAAVEGHDRADGAGSQTIDRGKRELTIRRGFVGLHLQLVFQGV